RRIQTGVFLHVPSTTLFRTRCRVEHHLIHMRASYILEIIQTSFSTGGNRCRYMDV
ncbi:unnamed protein product, partial [Ascophyllum nodosum]